VVVRAISTRPGDSDDVDHVAATITPQKRDQAKLKANCLARDNNRCMLTGIYEVLSDVERQNITAPETEAAHIIPFSLAAFDEREVPLFPSPIIFTSTNSQNSVIPRPPFGTQYTVPYGPWYP
jgi:hypothetical protein